MRKILNVLLAVFIALGVCCLNTSEAHAREGFEINKHTVEMDVHEDGTILVTETMDVVFTSSTLHGIYVNIPKKYNMKWDLNGQTYYKEYVFPVRKVKVLSDHNYEKEDFEEGVQIKIGDADSFANTYETYKWQYEIITRDLDLDNRQMLFMNIVSGKWDTVTHSVDFLINMPKEFNRSKLLFDSPVGVTSESKDALSIVVTGKTISGSYNADLQPGDAITVQLSLDDDYFKFISNDKYGLSAMIISGIFTIIMATAFFLFGKDDPLIESVEFHAPSGMTSAEVGVIIDGVANDGDVASLILDWGRRGLINIVDEEETLTLIKKADLEPTARSYERVMFDKLFSNGDEVDIESLSEVFYTTIHRVEKMLDKYFDSNKRRLFTRRSVALQSAMTILSFIPIGVASFMLYYNYYYDLPLSFIWVAIDAITIIAFSSIMVYLDNNRYVHKWYTKTLLYVLSLVLFTIPVIILVFITVRTHTSIWFSFVCILFNIVVIVITRFMKKRTDYGNQVLGQVIGLRNFIIVAEEDRLQELVDENPYYFYDILPFAYALGLTDVWNDHFKKLTIQPCEWYSSRLYGNPYYMTNSLTSQMHVIERAMTSAPAPESSSGGFSSGGGSSGGFSGGGFGGSGGGGW
ncbi:MAG: DUF2207 domain-containing protein [Erysipelotrichaceae bacterium]|nr:DUF2207 domain-containing protein [Erysipelotrichaceae bacterium]